jgi:hypothetical protein
MKKRNLLKTSLFMLLCICCHLKGSAQNAITGIPEGWKVNGLTVIGGIVSDVADTSLVVLAPPKSELKRIKSIKVKIASQKAKAEKKVEAVPQVVIQEPKEPIAEKKAESAPVVEAKKQPQKFTLDKTALRVGWIIAANGKVYAQESDVQNDHTTPLAVIYHLSKDSNSHHGLAIALEDASTERYSWKDAATAIDQWAASYPVEGATWRLPSVDDLKHLKEKNSVHNWLLQSIKKNGQAYFYWTATETDGRTASYYHFNTKEFQNGNKTHSFCVRAVMAF